MVFETSFLTQRSCVKSNFPYVTKLTIESFMLLTMWSVFLLINLIISEMTTSLTIFIKKLLMIRLMVFIEKPSQCIILLIFTLILITQKVPRDKDVETSCVAEVNRLLNLKIELENGETIYVIFLSRLFNKFIFQNKMQVIQILLFGLGITLLMMLLKHHLNQQSLLYWLLTILRNIIQTQLFTLFMETTNLHQWIFKIFQKKMMRLSTWYPMFGENGWPQMFINSSERSLSMTILPQLIQKQLRNLLERWKEQEYLLWTFNLATFIISISLQSLEMNSINLTGLKRL